MALTKKLMLIPYFLILVEAANRCHFVKPDNSTCQANPCETLEFYASSKSEYFTDNTSFVFLPGTHVLSDISISNVTNVTLIASTEPEGNVTIQCNGSGGLVFQHAFNVTLGNLSFVSCGQPLPHSLQREGETAQAALAFGQVTDLRLESVSVSHSRGYGLLGHCVHGDFNITNSHFTSNKGSGHYLGGNAAIEYIDCTSLAAKSNVQISSSTFSYGGYDDRIYIMENCKQTNATGLHIVSNNNIIVNISDVTMANNENNNPFCGNGGNLFIFSAYNYKAVGSNNVTITNSSFINGTAWNGAGVLLSFYVPKCLNASERVLPSNNILLYNTNISHNTGNGLSYEFVMSNAYDSHTHINCPHTSFTVNNSRFDGNTLKIEFMSNFQFLRNGVAVHVIAKFNNNKALKVYNKYYRTTFAGCTFKNSKRMILKDSGNNNMNRFALDVMTIKNINMDSSLCDCKIIHNEFPGIGLSNSKIIVWGSILLQNNTGRNGGGMLFCESSYLILTKDTNISLIGNHAVQLGGGIYIEGGCLHSTPFCFYQPDYNEEWSCSNISKSITLDGNIAGYAGDHIYGGNLDRCTFLNCNSSNLFQNLFTVNISGVTSNPRRVCFCTVTGKPDCDQSNGTKFSDAIYPGEFVEVDVAIVGQFNTPVPGTVIYYTRHLDDFKSEVIDTHCKNLNVQVRTNETKQVNVSIQLTSNFINSSENTPYLSASEPLTIVVTLKKCPPGFNHRNGTCECDEKLSAHKVQCDITEKTILRVPPVWIGHISDGHHDEGIVYHPVCPYNYCLDETVNITSNGMVLNQDSQCAQNRTGLLCSQCEEGTTLSMGSFKCMKCENKVALPATILSYMLFGVMLVLLLVVFNITYTDGTFSGLLFYANIVNLNGSIFLSQAHVNLSFRVILNWMSFGRGFDSCFYDGMDSYAKAWVTLFFPNYLIIINTIVIFLCNKSKKLARLFGENIVKVLATILIVSYTTLIQFVVTALSFTVIQYPPDSTTVVWTSDPTLEYFSGKHIPLALVAIVFGLLILAFTMVLLCVQPLQRYSHLRCFSWMAKLKPFIDAYTAPHIIKDNCRYWEGLLLFFRLIITGIISVSTKSIVSRNLGAIVCVCVLLLTIAWCVGGVYKKPSLNILNSSYILNLAAIAVAGSHTDNKDWDTADFKPILYISYTVAISTAGIVLAHHTYLRAKSWHAIWKRQQYKQLPAENKDDDMLANLRRF